MQEIAVAVIGSTGGGTATLGHTNPPELMKIIDRELRKLEGTATCIGIARGLFVALEGGKGFDNVDETKDIASLYEATQSKNGPLKCQVVKSGTLKEVNSLCRDLNKDLARLISDGTVNALVCISTSVDIFAETLQIAAKTNIPVTGTGGTSLSLATSRFQIRLVGNAGGSVANTSLTRAVSYAHALATDFKAVYRPWVKIGVHPDREKAPSWRSILNACLPVFWGVCIARSLLAAGAETLESLCGIRPENLSLLVYALENHAIPTACAVVAATSGSEAIGQDTSSRIMSSVLASSVGCRSILCGFLAGHLVSQWQEKVLYWCIVKNIPATMTNLVTTGSVGAFIALVLFPLVPALQSATALVRETLLLSANSSTAPPGLGAFLWGTLCCYGSKVGWYHSIFLPLILIEMECGHASFLGAIDELTLVLVCAGVCCGTLVASVFVAPTGLLSETDLALCRRAVRINLLYGDFVEACYPFMEHHPIINIGCYVASGISSAQLVTQQETEVPKSLAYLPLPVSIWMAGGAWHSMLLASVTAFFIPFFATILNCSLWKAPKNNPNRDN